MIEYKDVIRKEDSTVFLPESTKVGQLGFENDGNYRQRRALLSNSVAYHWTPDEMFTSDLVGYTNTNFGSLTDLKEATDLLLSGWNSISETASKLNGNLVILSHDSAYDGGIRVAADSSHYALLALGTTTDLSGTQDGQWNIMRAPTNADPELDYKLTFFFDSAEVAKLSKEGKFTSGNLMILSNDTAYDGGIRIAAENDHYVTLALGTSTAASGTQAGQWNILRYPTNVDAELDYKLSFFYDTTEVAKLSKAGKFTTENLIVNNNVGIGTTNPTSELHVEGDVLINGSLTGLTDLEVNESIVVNSTIYQPGDGNYFGLYLENNSVPERPGETLPVLKTDGTHIYFSQNGKYTAYLGGTEPTFSIRNNGGYEKIRLATNGNSFMIGGNIGIGTTTAAMNPTEALDIWGNLNVRGTISGTFNPSTFLIGTSPSNNYFWDFAIGKYFTFKQDNEWSSYINHNAYYNSGWKYRETEGACATSLNIGDEGYTFKVAAAGTKDASITFIDALRIKTNGYVGIGTTNPTEMLEVFGSIKHYYSYCGNSYVFTGTAGVIKTSNDNTGITFLPDGDMSFVNGTLTAMVIKTDAKVGIGTTAPSEVLDVNGNARIRSIGSGTSAGALHYTSDGTLTVSTSDARLKHDIQPLSDYTLQKIMDLNPVNFKWNGTNKESIGLIAQEVAEILPELAFTNSNDGYMGIHYDLLSAILVKGIQQLKINYDSKIKELEEKIELLSKRFDYL